MWTPNPTEGGRDVWPATQAKSAAPGFLRDLVSKDQVSSLIVLHPQSTSGMCARVRAHLLPCAPIHTNTPPTHMEIKLGVVGDAYDPSSGG